MYHASKSKGKRGYKGTDRKEYIKANHLRVKSWKNIKIWAVKQYEKEPVKTIASMLGVSETAIYTWVKLCKAHGKEAFTPRSRRPKNIKRIPKEIMEKILEVRDKTHYGCEKIALVLKITSHMSVYRTLVAFGKIESKSKKKRRKWRFFERKHPNSLWQMDLKQISDTEWSISILDDHSRYLVGCKIYDHVPSKDDIIDLLEEAMANYGKPEQILTDHGTQFYANKKSENGLGVSTFDLWCYEQGIRHILAGVRKPTTNGKVERWHRTMNDEFLKYTDPSRVKEKLKEFLDWYNNERIHFGFVEVKREDGSIKRKRITFIPADRFFASAEKGI